MKRALIAAAGLAVAGIVVSASPAFAWDCIRVSSSQQGLMQSSQNGQWEYMTIDNLIQGGIQDGYIDATQAPCLKQEWAALGEPQYFAIGAGVAGAGAKGAQKSGHITDQSFFELAKNAPVKVMVNGKGVDHLDDAIAMILPSCPPAG